MPSSCCKPSPSTSECLTITAAGIDDTYNLVSTAYAAHASKSSQATRDSTQSTSHVAVAAAFGYTPDSLASLPATANLGVSCGNPLALANLRAGEVLLDLGSGGGLDVLLAARAVGPTGRAIGVDMTPTMIELATRNAEKAGLGDVAMFKLGHITDIPVESGSVDVVISNCVINLVPNSEKPQVFRECARVLKKGGRVAISDILTREGTEMPEEVRDDAGAYLACVGGAAGVGEYRRWMDDAGFVGRFLSSILLKRTMLTFDRYHDCGYLEGLECL